MERQYYNRYNDFIFNEQPQIVPMITIPVKSTDKFITFKKNRDRLDTISQEKYGTPYFGWLILLANPQAGVNEFDIPNGFLLRVPFPLLVTLQDYKNNVDLFKFYYGE